MGRKALLTALVTVAVLASAPSAASATFTFRGRGWGHGAGMSQWGARGLAEKGKTAGDILKHYYTGTSVQTKTAPSKIRVGLLQERAEIWVEGNGRFDLYDKGGTRKASGKKGERWRIVPDGTTLEVFSPASSTKPVFRSGVPVTVKWEEHGTYLDLPQTGYEYKRGRMDVDINATTGKTRAILIIPFEEYLYGLGEMPSSWHHEALEAQAIAGRTYALEKITRLGQGRSVCNCGVYASTADQAYVGVQHEVAKWVEAVNTTKGLVVTYGGKPIQAYYSSSNGGFSENNENVFGGDPIPYLRGKCDPGDYFNGGNPHNAWTVTMEDTEVSKRLRDAGHDVGRVTDIDFLSPRGVSGRVIGVKSDTQGGVRIQGTIGSKRLGGGTFRSIMGLKTNLIFHHVMGAIRLRYDGMNCKPGLPTGSEFGWKDLNGTKRGRAQNFAEGRLFFNSATNKTWWTSKGFTVYYDTLRDKGIDLRMPTGDSVAVTGATGKGKVSPFENGNLFFASKPGTHEVHGLILKKYKESGYYKKWGFPTSDELPAPGGATSRFEKARIYFSNKYGAKVVYGAILEEYKRQGGGAGKLGMPKSDEYKVTTGKRQDFAKGYITWNSVTKKTAYKLT